ncbi:MAG: Flp pilus assembly protein CpaB [Methylococcaceae bacterium]|nr:Flp pilus assembly protein CpaB [Methylococcaceae bacterium]
MLTGRTLLLLFVALVLAILAVLIAQRWVESLGNGGAQQVQYTPVIVAAENIPQWGKVEELQVTEKNWPKETVTQDMFTEKSQVLGKYAIDKVFKGEPLNRRRMIERKEGSILSLVFPENKRAFTVRVNDVSGVGGFLSPGDRVDLLVSRKQPGLNEETRTETLLQDIKVLAVDQEATSEKIKPIVVRSVTLEVTPQQAEEAFNAQQQGPIQLTLRNPADKTLVEKPETIARGVAPPTPKTSASEPDRKPYTIIRGSVSSRGICGRFECTEKIQ